MMRNWAGLKVDIAIGAVPAGACQSPRGSMALVAPADTRDNVEVTGPEGCAQSKQQCHRQANHRRVCMLSGLNRTARPIELGLHILIGSTIGEGRHDPGKAHKTHIGTRDSLVSQCLREPQTVVDAEYVTVRGWVSCAPRAKPPQRAGPGQPRGSPGAHCHRTATWLQSLAVASSARLLQARCQCQRGWQPPRRRRGPLCTSRVSRRRTWPN